VADVFSRFTALQNVSAQIGKNTNMRASMAGQQLFFSSKRINSSRLHAIYLKIR